MIKDERTLDSITIELLTEGYVANHKTRRMFFEKFNIHYAPSTVENMCWASCPKCFHARWVPIGKMSSLCSPCNFDLLHSKRVEFKEIETKKCSACLCEKSVSEFYKNARVISDGYRNLCKDCLSAQCKDWRSNNTDKIKQYQVTRYKISSVDPKEQVCQRMSNLVRYSIKRKGKNKEGISWKLMVDYSPADLMLHIEKQFKDGVGWHNMNEWHIDHKLPISSFEFSHYTDEGFKKCWALENLQPLWAVENMKKYNKILNEVLYAG